MITALADSSTPIESALSNPNLVGSDFFASPLP
jgi:hypothetical protein